VLGGKLAQFLTQKSMNIPQDNDLQFVEWPFMVQKSLKLERFCKSNKGSVAKRLIDIYVCF